MCVEKAILMCLIPILVGLIYDGITPFKGFAPINELKAATIHIRFNIVLRYQECA